MAKEFYNRVVYDRVTADWMKEIGADRMDAGEISGDLCKRYGFKSHIAYRYPKYDVCADPFTDGEGNVVQHDIILAEQIWEHLDRPYRATKNILTMLKSGGYFWLASPFFARHHAVPVDCSRWSARGLKNLLIECGFDETKIRAEQWGNRACARRDMRPRWARYDPETDSLENDPNFPVMAWALAQK